MVKVIVTVKQKRQYMFGEHDLKSVRGSRPQKSQNEPRNDTQERDIHKEQIMIYMIHIRTNLIDKIMKTVVPSTLNNL